MLMDIQTEKNSAAILIWCLVVPVLLGFSRSNDPILTHMCSAKHGAKFWREFLDCSVLLDPQMLTVLNTCVPISTVEEAESTRCSICSRPDQWLKRMECINAHLIELQDESDPHLELGPDEQYRICVNVLIMQANRSLYEDVPLLPEDDRRLDSNCSGVE